MEVDWGFIFGLSRTFVSVNDSIGLRVMASRCSPLPRAAVETDFRTRHRGDLHARSRWASDWVAGFRGLVVVNQKVMATTTAVAQTSRGLPPSPIIPHHPAPFAQASRGSRPPLTARQSHEQNQGIQNVPGGSRPGQPRRPLPTPLSLWDFSPLTGKPRLLLLRLAQASRGSRPPTLKFVSHLNQR
ncbi:MAG: hypothetical protein LQ344_005473 [Seirophora lacunosa]|nr:MAG: hypothetical protein LQ344_005473 [Seirophora lacunosa]